jgi:hypothetical protein
MKSFHLLYPADYADAKCARLFGIEVLDFNLTCGCGADKLRLGLLTNGDGMRLAACNAEMHDTNADVQKP